MSELEGAVSRNRSSQDAHRCEFSIDGNSFSLQDAQLFVHAMTSSRFCTASAADMFATGRSTHRWHEQHSEEVSACVCMTAVVRDIVRLNPSWPKDLPHIDVGLEERHIAKLS